MSGARRTWSQVRRRSVFARYFGSAVGSGTSRKTSSSERRAQPGIGYAEQRRIAGGRIADELQPNLHAPLDELVRMIL